MKDSIFNTSIILKENEINGEYDTRRYLINGEIISFSIKDTLGNRNGIFLISSNNGPAEIHYSQLANFFFDTEYNNSREKVSFGQVILKNGTKCPIIPDKVNDFWNLVKGRRFRVISNDSPYRFLIPNKQGAKYRQCGMTRADFILLVTNLIENKNFMELRGYCKTAKKYDFMEV